MPDNPNKFLKYFRGQDEASETSIRDVMNAIWRGKYIVLACCAVVTAIATLVIKQVEPRYNSASTVMIESRKLQVVNVEDVLSGMALDAAIVMTEVEVLRSPDLVGRVVDRLGLHNVPELTLSAKERKPGGLVNNAVTFVNNLIGGDDGKQVVMPKSTLTERGKRGRAIGTILGGLEVAPRGRSLVINIGFTATDPVLSALVANAVAEQYLADQLNAKRVASERANSWLTERIEDLRGQLRQSEADVERYRAQKNLIEGKGSRVGDQQLAELNSQIVVAQAQRAEAKVRLDIIRDLKTKSLPLDSAAEVQGSPIIQNLKREESKLLQLSSQLSTRYGDRHPKIVNVRAEIQNVNSRLSREMSRIVQSIENEHRVANARVRTLRANLSQLKGQVATQNKADIRLRELERQAKANRQLYEAFLNRLKETTDQEGIQTPDARILSKANVPSAPSFPRTKLTVLMAALGSAFFGVLLVFLREKLDNQFKSADEIEDITGIRSLGLVPYDKFINKEIDLKNVVSLDDSLFTESIRGLHATISPSNLPNASSVFAISSTLPSEGKTVTSVSLARIAAKSGQKTIIIDCDLRRPNVHKTAKLSNEHTIVDVLTGSMSLDEAIVVDGNSGTHVLTSTVFRGNPLDLLRSDRMRELVEYCKQHYDLVILDTPSILAVADAKIVAALAQKLVYVVKWDSIPRDAVLAGIKQFTDMNIEFSGVTMTQVNLKKHAKYGYLDSTYYYGSYRENYVH